MDSERMHHIQTPIEAHEEVESDDENRIANRKHVEKRVFID